MCIRDVRVEKEWITTESKQDFSGPEIKVIHVAEPLGEAGTVRGWFHEAVSRAVIARAIITRLGHNICRYCQMRKNDGDE